MSPALQIFIAEDEPPARERLIATLAEVAPAARVVGHSDTVRGTRQWLAAHAAPDLLLLDIQLADGLSLELFEGAAALALPTVFTTAYDQFALPAFKALAIDYLLKPVGAPALAQALAKREALTRLGAPQVEALLNRLRPAPAPEPRQRLLGRQGGQFRAVALDEIAYIVSLDKLSHAVLADGRRLLVERPLAELERELDARRFFRANRQLLVAAAAVQGFAPVGRGRLALELRPALGAEALVSQERAAEFRAWLDR